jgi:hypothetical protein
LADLSGRYNYNNYDLDADTPMPSLSYRGADPDDRLVSLLAKSPDSETTFADNFLEHVNDYRTIMMERFPLTLVKQHTWIHQLMP